MEFDATLPTGQGSATDIMQLAYQPGLWHPWEQQDPTAQMQAHPDYCLVDEDPLAHVDWKERRSEENHENAGLIAEPQS